MSEENMEVSTEEVDQTQTRAQNHLLIEREQYLSHGVHIGTKLKTKHTQNWIYRTTSYGLFVININATDARLRIAAKFLAKFDPKKILICSIRRYGRKPVAAFAEVVGAVAKNRRFIPGTLTNPMIDDYFEADVIVIIDPHADKQALQEARLARIPVVALIDTDDVLNTIEVAIPTNNRGRKALSLIMYLLARQIQREKGAIPPDGDIGISKEDFESKIMPKRDTKPK